MLETCSSYTGVCGRGKKRGRETRAQGKNAERKHDVQRSIVLDVTQRWPLAKAMQENTDLCVPC